MCDAIRIARLKTVMAGPDQATHPPARPRGDEN